MKYEIDADFEACGKQILKELGIPPDRPTPRFPRGDIASRRQGASFVKAILALEPEVSNVVKTRYTALAEDGHEVPVFAYRKQMARDNSTLQPAVLYFHGGGMIFGSAELFEPATKSDVADTGVAHFSVDYRLAPEARHPIPVQDCYSALVWLHSQAKHLGIDNSRISVVGLSAGGGLAAGVSLMARDRGLDPPIAKQILLTPMLDNRNTEADPELAPFVTWSWDDNWTGWNALLGEEAGSHSASEYAAPARAENLSGLPSTYIDVGTLDIFAEEIEQFALRLREAGVSVESHLYEGVPHGFEFRGRGSKIVQRAQSNRRAAMQSF